MKCDMSSHRFLVFSHICDFSSRGEGLKMVPRGIVTKDTLPSHTERNTFFAGGTTSNIEKEVFGDKNGEIVWFFCQREDYEMVVVVREQEWEKKNEGEFCSCH